MKRSIEKLNKKEGSVETTEFLESGNCISNTSEAIHKRQTGPLKFKQDENGNVVNQDNNQNVNDVLLETTGTSDHDLAVKLLDQVKDTVFVGNTEQKANYTAALMHGLNPQDELEGVLITQMAAVHNLSLEYMRRAMIPEQSAESVNENTQRALRLMSLFTKQLDVLQKYRGKMGHQTVTVEHVHVNQGGQAIVGHIQHRGGDKKES